MSALVNSVAWLYDLYRIGQAVAGAQDSGRAQQAILEHVVAGFQAASGSLALIDKDGRHLTLVAGIKLPAGVIGSKIALGERVLGYVAAQGEALLLNGDIAKDPRFKNLQARAQTGIPVVAMCWPLRIESRVIGAVSVNRDHTAPAFTESDLAHGAMIMNLVAIVIENALLHGEERRRIAELSALNQKLEQTQGQLLQSEKMASIGQLAAGVAHEINNPVGYVSSNLGTLQRYVEDLLRLLGAYECVEPALPAAALAPVQALKQELDLGFLLEDTQNLVRESLEGVGRVRKIVQDLKEFSHVDRAEWQLADLHVGIDSTLNIVHNEVKYRAEVVKAYAALPPVECIPSQLNQVFMNLLVNAAQAMENRGQITIRTGQRGEQVFVEIADTGKGIAPEHLNRVFEPFFTTKPVGKGTGLGLSLAYNIVKTHHGRIEVESAVDKGTTVRVWVPVKHEPAAADEPLRKVGT
jgi:signal transduction histidine kinase